jgi:Ca2+-binding RTX toxin-like protein
MSRNDEQQLVMSLTDTSLRSGDPGQSGSSSSGAAAEAAFRSLKDGALSVLDTQLAALYAGATQDTAAAAILNSPVEQASDAAASQYVVIDATARSGDGAALLDDLVALGLKEGGSFGDMASGLLPVDQVDALLTLSDLGFASTSEAQFSAGSVDSQAGPALEADAARSIYSVNGSGIPVGVLSDSFDNLGGMSGDIASGDLPANTSILSDQPSGGSDEGRAMAQIVHDIAPGSPILFDTAFAGQANFANSIIALADAGAKVIVDDVLYFAETAFQDGPIAQAVDQVTATGVAYFSATGNNGRDGYEAAFTSSGVTGPYSEPLAKLTTAASGQYLPVTIPANTTARFVLQWDQPGQSVSGGTGAQNDLDLFLYNSSNTLVSQAVSDNVGHDPREIITYTNNGTATSFKLAVGLFSGAAPGDFKLMALDNGAGVTLGASSLNTNFGTVYGHAAAESAIAVAAASYARTPAYGTNPPVVEGFSSEGPTRILFDTAGNALGTPDIRNAPQITAADGGDTTFFGSDAEGNGLPNFFGTSAAAPAAAAVAALMLQANDALISSDILNLLMDSAIDMDNPPTAGFDAGFDARTGAGLIQADKAVGFAKTLNITGSAGNDLLLGTHLADTLDGGAGVDTMKGGTGNDIYYVDNTADEVTELAGGGSDTVYAGVDYALGAASEIEFLRANAGTAGLYLTGNALTNRVFGRSGNDTLDGGGGADRLAGGTGDDIYIVDNSGVAIVEQAAAGIDAVQSTLSLTLAANVEDLTLLGLDAINGVGNALDNTMLGNDFGNVIKGEDGADILIGGGSMDRLTGGAVADRFGYQALGDSAVGAADRIFDFSGVTEAGEGDRIDLTGLEASLGQSFTFHADGKFHGGSGDVRSYVNAAGNTAVEVDTTGDRSADFQMLLTGSHTVSASDVIF